MTLSACAICHSDISFADGAWGGSLPAVYGHEAAGHITALGDGVRGYQTGDTVIVTLIRACGTCAPCASGTPVACSTPYDGDMPMDAASLLSCGVITGVGAVVNSAGLKAGQDVVVIGACGVGLNAIQGARIAGARRIVAIDTTEEKLDAAMGFGATDGILASSGAPAAARRSLGKGAETVIVTVGAIPAYEQAPEFLAPGGRVIMVGMPHSGAKVGFEPVNFAAAGQGMIGSKMGDVVLRRDIPWMLDLYAQGRLKLDELISGRWPLEQINEAIADTKSGAARRNVIIFDR